MALAPDGADGKLANVGFAAMQKPKFYRERAQVAMELAELFRDQIAKQMLQRPLNVGESLRGSLGHENEAERRAKPKSGDTPTRRCHHCPAFHPRHPTAEMRITPQCRCSASGRRGRDRQHRQPHRHRTSCQRGDSTAWLRHVAEKAGFKVGDPDRCYYRTSPAAVREKRQGNRQGATSN